MASLPKEYKDKIYKIIQEALDCSERYYFESQLDSLREVIEKKDKEIKRLRAQVDSYMGTKPQPTETSITSEGNFTFNISGLGFKELVVEGGLEVLTSSDKKDTLTIRQRKN